jgi:magnesium transporter
VQILDNYDSATIDDLVSRDEFFWLDLAQPDQAMIDTLGERFGFHPLALEDALKSGQRPKLQGYGDHMFLVYYGVPEEGDGDDPMLIEVHAFLSGSYIITLRERPCGALADLRKRLPRMNDETEQFVIYRVLEALTDSFFPALERLEDQIDALESEILEAPDDTHLQRIFGMRRHLVGLRKVVAPQRDLLVHGTDDILQLPGLEHDSRNYFRDLYDHMLRISDQIDSSRELLSSSRDAYLSMVSNRLNSISKQLTIVATIFLPLAFITGFFGQNFQWMTDHIESFADFAIFGIGGVVFGAVGLYAWFRKLGYI